MRGFCRDDDITHRSKQLPEPFPMQHSWLVAPDGRILDPTRWAILSPKKPSIYLGPNDCYDEGGRMLAARMPPPFPGTRNPWGEAIEKMNAATRSAMAQALRTDPGNLSGIAFRLEHAVKDDPSRVPEAEVVYRILQQAGRKAMVPIDNWVRVMEPEKLYCRAGTNRAFELPPAPEMNDVEIIAAVFGQFLSIEERPDIEAELQQLGYSLDKDLWKNLNQIDWMKEWLPMYLLPLDMCDTLCAIAGDLLGKGFGQTLRVERFAASLGVDIRRLAGILASFGDRAGYTLGWDVPERLADRPLPDTMSSPRI